MLKHSPLPPLILSFAVITSSQALGLETDLGLNASFVSSELDTHKDEHEDDHHDEVETIVVQASRSGRIANEQPIRVELINREEIEEKAAMRPGNISMLVAETGGVRVQTTSLSTTIQ